MPVVVFARLTSAIPVSWPFDLSIYIRALVVGTADRTPDSVIKIPRGLYEKMPAPIGALAPVLGVTQAQPT